MLKWKWTSNRMLIIKVTGLEKAMLAETVVNFSKKYHRINLHPQVRQEK